ncbi:MAG: TniQ family protein [Coleofasciculus sp. S288]|nr:TniQ family protein [Coleofasciculus sp. S288]
MGFDVLTSYDTWDLTQPILLPRSHLYQLEPIGIGTPLVESLTSFIARLAEVHCVPPRILISKIITPFLEQIFVKRCTNRGLRSLFDRARALNGTGRMARDFVEALEKLTVRDDLRFLTLLNWSDILVPRGLLRERKAWCPACYKQWRTSGRVVYEPLLWSIDAVTVCLSHHQPLCNHCPHCQQQLPLLTWRTRPGYCSICGEWLGITSNWDFSKGKIPSADESGWHSWVANTIGELIAVAPYLSLPLTQIKVTKALCAAIEIVTQGNIAAFAALLKMPKNTVWGWQAGKVLPPLDALVKISHCLGISLVDFLTQEVDIIKTSKKLLLPSPGQQKKIRASPRSFDSTQVQQALSSILAESQQPPPTLKEVAESLGYNRRLLYRHFPDLCYAIAAKSRQYLHTRRLEAVAHCCEEVRQATLKLHSQGEYPTEARVSLLISKPGYFRYKQVRSALLEARRELGERQSKMLE